MLTACAAPETVYDGPRILPHYRFATYTDGNPVLHYTGDSNAAYASQYHTLPPAVGPMRVNCRNLDYIGIRFDEPGERSSIYGAMTKYRFEWTHSEYPGSSERGMRYWRNNPWTVERNTYTADSLLRIYLRPENWLENGSIKLHVSVEGSVVFETEFELIDCLANLYRTPTPPSDLIEQP